MGFFTVFGKKKEKQEEEIMDEQEVEKVKEVEEIKEGNYFIMIYLKSGKELRFISRPFKETKINYENFVKSFKRNKFLLNNPDNLIVKCKDISTIGYYKEVN